MALNLENLKKKYSEMLKGGIKSAKTNIPQVARTLQSNVNLIGSDISKNVIKPVSSYLGKGQEKSVQAERALGNKGLYLQLQTTPTLTELAGAGKLPRPIQRFAETEFKLPELTGISKYSPINIANKYLVESGVNLTRGILFGNPEETRQVQNILKKAETGSKILPEEQRLAEKFASYNMLNIAGLSEGLKAKKPAAKIDGKILQKAGKQLPTGEIIDTTNKLTGTNEAIKKAKVVPSTIEAPTGVVGETFVIPQIGKPLTKVQAKNEALKALNVEPNKPIALLPAGPNISRSEVYNKLANLENYIGGRTATAEELQKGFKEVSPYTRTVRQAAENISTRIGDLTASENPVLRSMGTLMRGLAGGLGKTEADVVAKRQFLGQAGYATNIAEKFTNYLQKGLLNNSEESATKIFNVLDPELATKKLDITDLADNEKEALAVLRQMSDFINDLNYINNLNSYESWYKNRGGKYIARAYEPYEFPPEASDYVKQYGIKLDLGGTQKREVIDSWKQDNAIRNPIYLMSKRLQQALFNDSVKEWSNYIAKTKYVSNNALPGYVQLSDSKVYGDLAGKYVRKDFVEDIKGFYFTNDTLNKLYSVFKDYSRNPVSRFYKKLLTVFNPATQLGNNTGNFFFATINGINPVKFATYYKSSLKDITSNSPLYKRMMKDSLVMNDITKEDIIRLATDLKSVTKDKGLLRKIDEIASKAYGGSDDLAKVSAMKYWLDKGYSYSEASRRVFNSFQNYSTVGFLYNIGANIPVFGNPFVRFKADVLRILKNAAVDHPFALAGTVGALAVIGNIASALAGESAEDRKTRETRVGAQRIPFTNISLNFQTPFGEISSGRLLGFYNSNTTADSQFFNDLSTYAPFSTEVSDPLAGPLYSAFITDKDFRGKTISDPEANKYTGSLLTEQEKMLNRANFLRRSYQGALLNSLEDTAMAVMGKEDFYGRTLTPAQAILRMFPGVKVEQYGPEQAELARERNNYYENVRQNKIDENIKAVNKQYLEGKIDENTYNKRISNFETLKNNDASINQTGSGEGYIIRNGVLAFLNDSGQQVSIDINKFAITPNDTPNEQNKKQKLKESAIKKIFNDLSLSDNQKAEMLQAIGSSENEVYDVQYGVDEVKKIEGTDTISNIKRNNLALDKLNNIYKDRDAGLLTDEIVNGLLNRLGVPKEDADYYYTATQDANIRYELVSQTINSFTGNREDLIIQLAPLRQKINNKMVLNDSLINELYNNDLITKNEKKILQAIIYKDGKLNFEKAFKESSKTTGSKQKTEMKNAIKGAIKARKTLVKARKAQYKIPKTRAKIKVSPITSAGIKRLTLKPISVKNIAQLSSNRAR